MNYTEDPCLFSTRYKFANDAHFVTRFSFLSRYSGENNRAVVPSNLSCLLIASPKIIISEEEKEEISSPAETLKKERSTGNVFVSSKKIDLNLKTF